MLCEYALSLSLSLPLPLAPSRARSLLLSFSHKRIYRNLEDMPHSWSRVSISAYIFEDEEDGDKNEGSREEEGKQDRV